MPRKTRSRSQSPRRLRFHSEVNFLHSCIECNDLERFKWIAEVVPREVLSEVEEILEDNDFVMTSLVRAALCRQRTEMVKFLVEERKVIKRKNHFETYFIVGTPFRLT